MLKVIGRDTPDAQPVATENDHAIDSNGSIVGERWSPLSLNIGQLGNPKLEFVHQSGALSIQAFGVVNQSFNPPRWVNG